MATARESLEELRHVERMLVLRPASSDELRNAILYLIETVSRLVAEVDEARQSSALPTPARADPSVEAVRLKQSS